MKKPFWLFIFTSSAATYGIGGDMTVSSLAGYGGQSNIVLQATGNIVLKGGDLDLTALGVGSGGGGLTIESGSSILLPAGAILKAPPGWTISLKAANSITFEIGSGIEADGGKITLSAAIVYHDGLIQANSRQNDAGSIQIRALRELDLGADARTSAHGDSVGISPGGSVTIQSANDFSDQSGSVIDISGGVQGGNGGRAEILAPRMNAINSAINGQALEGFVGGSLSLDPLNIVLAASSSDPNAQYSGSVTAGSPPASGTLTLNVNDFSAGLSQINLAAINNITFATAWNLANATAPATLTLNASNSIIFNNNTSISAGNNWSVSLNAGTGFVPAAGQTKPPAGSINAPSYGIYFGDSAYLQTQNGNIEANALNDVLVDSAPSFTSGIRTVGGGNITVAATDGNVTTGGNNQGYVYNGQTAPYQY